MSVPSGLSEPIPGTLLVSRGNRLSVLIDGARQDHDLPYLMRRFSARLSADGSIAAAVLFDPYAQQGYVWSVRLPGAAVELVPTTLPVVATGVSWSPDLARFVSIDPAEDPPASVLVGDRSGVVERIEVGGTVLSWTWRSAEELTLATATAAGPRDYPQEHVTIWRVTTGSDPEPIGTTSLARGKLAWSADGERLAVVAIGEDGPGSEEVQQVFPRSATLLRARDILATDTACILRSAGADFLDLAWDANDGILVAGKQRSTSSNYFVAALSGSGTLAMFGSPASCYISGSLDHSTHRTAGPLFISLFGPECGTSHEENRVVVVDPETLSPLGEFVTGIKRSVTPSRDGTAFVTTFGDSIAYARIDPAGSGRFMAAVPLEPGEHLVGWVEPQ